MMMNRNKRDISLFLMLFGFMLCAGKIVDLTKDDTTNECNDILKLMQSVTVYHLYDSDGNPITATPDMSGKADKVSGATDGNLAALDASGNLYDAGAKISDYATVVDVSAKSDKVSGAVNGNLAALDATGNLTDSGAKPADYAAAASVANAAKWDQAYADTTAATDANTASTTVKRDAFGGFSANTITADLAGHADSATYADSAGTANVVLLENVNLGTSNIGSIYYANSTGVLAELVPGTSGEVLQTNGDNVPPSWETAASSGMALAPPSVAGTLARLDIAGQAYADENTPVIARNIDDTAGDGWNVQNGGFVADSDSDCDANYVWSNNGTPKWLSQLYRNEGGEFWYFANVQGETNVFTATENGRVGINNPTNIMTDDALFTGTGLNDVTWGGIYAKPYPALYRITIDGISGGGEDLFTFATSVNRGSSWSAESSAINCAITQTALSNGVTVAFGATTGHTLADTWTINAFAQLPRASLSVFPKAFDYVCSTTDYTAGTPTYTNQSYNANSSDAGTFIPFTSTLTRAVYVGSKNKFNSTYWNMVTTYGSNIGLTVEYLTGAGWVAMTGSHDFADGTIRSGSGSSLSQNGSIRWDKALMADWIMGDKPGQDIPDMYWVRFINTSTPSSNAVVQSITLNGDKRLSVQAGASDEFASFYVGADGTMGSEATSTADPSPTSNGWRYKGYTSVSAQAGYGVGSGGKLWFVGSGSSSYYDAVQMWAFNGSSYGKCMTFGSRGLAVGTTRMLTFRYEYSSVALGDGLHNLATGASANTTAGMSAGSALTISQGSTAIGSEALKSATSGRGYTAVGKDALKLANRTSDTTGYATAVGWAALDNLTSGQYVTALGTNAGSELTTGSNGVYIGNSAVPSASSNNNEIVIGDSTTGNGTNTVTIGNASITKTVLQGALIIPKLASVPSTPTSGTIALFAQGAYFYMMDDTGAITNFNP